MLRVSPLFACELRRERDSPPQFWIANPRELSPAVKESLRARVACRLPFWVPSSLTPSTYRFANLSEKVLSYFSWQHKMAPFSNSTTVIGHSVAAKERRFGPNLADRPGRQFGQWPAATHSADASNAKARSARPGSPRSPSSRRRTASACCRWQTADSECPRSRDSGCA